MAGALDMLSARGLPSEHPKAPSIQYIPVEPDLYDIFSDVMSICMFLNNAAPGSVLDIVVFEEILVSGCYRLLQFRCLNLSRLHSDLQSAYHFGLIIFMMTTFLQCHKNRIMNHALLSACIKDTLDQDWQDIGDESIFWLMMLGGIWVFGDVDGGWLAPKIRRLAHALGIDAWDDVQRTVCKFPWINDIHDDLARRLWNEVQSDNSI